MKFVILLGLFAVAFASLKSDLKTDTERLRKLAENEIKKLEAEGKEFLAEGLKIVDHEIVSIEKYLESLNPNTELGKIALNGVETLLKDLEETLEKEIKKLASSYYDSTIDELKADTEKLRKLAEQEIEKLKKEGKHYLAANLEVIDHEIATVEHKIETLNTNTEFGKMMLRSLETILKGLEKKLEEEIKKLGSSYYDSTIDELKADTEKLRKLAEQEIQKLEKEGKSYLAANLKVIVEEIDTVEKKIETLNTNTEVGKMMLHSLEAFLKGLEQELDEEIKKLGSSYYDSTIDELKADTEKLRKLAEQEIQKLEKEGKHYLAANLKVIVEEIDTVEKKMETLNTNTEFGKMMLHTLETFLKDLEKKLEEEIKKLGSSYYDSTIDELKADTEKLRKLAEQEIQKLEKEGKHYLAANLKVIDDEIATVEHKIETLNPNTEFGKMMLRSLETILKGLEKKLEEEIKNLSNQ